MKSLIIDNYDSFTFNLYQMIAKINGEPPIVVKNDRINLDVIAQLEIDNIIISPGPGHPDNIKDFGVCKDIILNVDLPILGVCLGHQGIACAHGGKVIQAPEPMHGRLCAITHEKDELYANIPNIFNAIRYHSLVISEDLPNCLEVTSRSSDNLIMSIRNKGKPIWGVQFHPESIRSEYGEQILENFKNITSSRRKKIKHYFSLDKISSRNEQSNPNFGHQLFVKKIRLDIGVEDLFNRLAQNVNGAIWLDSNSKNSGRFSILGVANGPESYQLQYNVDNQELKIIRNEKTIIKNQNLFDYLQEELQKRAVLIPTLPFEFACGFVGYFGYELKSETMPVKNNFSSALPDAQLLFLDQALVFDHAENECYLLYLTKPTNRSEAQLWFDKILQKIKIPSQKISHQSQALPPVKYSLDREAYLAAINKCLDFIRVGDSYEICLTNRIKVNTSVEPLTFYSTLRQQNPAPYSAFLKFENCTVACSSMERFLLIDAEKNVETKPIKGTMPRGKTISEDQSYIETLKNNEKFFSENLMIVDLLRNDLGQVCEIDSIHVPALMKVESYQTVHQLVTTIRGKLRADCNAIDAFKACFPGGSMTGAPKKRTVEILDQLEVEARGIYSGSIGYLSLNGCADLNIVIRTAVITDNELTIGVGGAIIAMSEPNEEYEETLLKAQSLLTALRLSI